jgi:hypothetical protein
MQHLTRVDEPLPRVWACLVALLNVGGATMCLQQKVHMKGQAGPEDQVRQTPKVCDREHIQ